MSTNKYIILRIDFKSNYDFLIISDGMFNESWGLLKRQRKHVLSTSFPFFVDSFTMRVEWNSGMDWRTKEKGETCYERNRKGEREGGRESKEWEKERDQLTRTFCRFFNEILERFDRQLKEWERQKEREKRGRRIVVFQWTRVALNVQIF